MMMLKLALSCLWVCIVTLASAYTMVAVKTRHAEASVPTKLSHVGYEKTSPINVPIIANGLVAGYVIIQLSYTINAEDGKKANVPIEAFLLDEAFKTLYGDEKLDFRHLERYDVASLTQNLIKKVNVRLNSPMVKDVLVEEFNYISKEDISK
jgi:hypothetical protein